MKSPFAIVICTALSMPVLAQQTEAMKHANPQAEAAAQARVEARAHIPPKVTIQPEAQRSFNARAAAVAETRKAQRLLSPRHPANQSRALLDSRKL
jgi:hypothetical protein